MSQSYSCWYSVLSLVKKQKQSKLQMVSILFLLVLGSVGYFFLFTFKNFRLNPILCCSRFLSLKVNCTFYQITVSILFLLVLGSVVKNRMLSVRITLCLNPILAGTGFCLRLSYFIA